MEKIDWDGVLSRLLLWQWLAAALALAIGVGVGLVYGKNLPLQVPIFYSLPWGEEQLSRPEMLVLPLGLCGAIAIFSSGVAVKKISDKVLVTIVTGVGLIAEIILILAFLRTIILVT